MAEVADRTAIAFRHRSAGRGRAVVLIHAFPVDGRLYDVQLSAAEAGRLAARVIAVDLPGFGQTPLPDPAPDVLTVEFLAEAVCGWIEAERLGPAIVGGVAIGGYVAIELAARRPDLVAGLVLIGCKAAPDNPTMAPKREELAQLALDRGAAAVADELHAQPLGPHADGAVKARMHEMISSADPRAIAALIRGIARRPDPAPVLPGLAMPSLVICGERDPFSPLDEARRVAQLMPNADLVIIKGAGHMAPLEAPIAVSRALAGFLDRLNQNQTPGGAT
ncbi:MAG: alpha/beta hydrolase [Chloroflexota bacterium]